MITIIEHHVDNWGSGPVVETLCPHCRASIIDFGVSERECWACGGILPRLYRFFRIRNTARKMYYAKRFGGKEDNASVQTP